MPDTQPDYNYLELLNPQQKEAVTYKDGPALVIAGAGSGKTRVLTYKIVDLIRFGMEPWRIMALTFTNKAAREMKERVAAVAGEKIASQLWMGTFHSVFLKILRRHADRLGFNSGFTIYDTADSRSLIKTIIKELNLDDKKYKPSTIQNIISNAKNALITPKAYRSDSTLTETDAKASRPMTAEIYRLYAERCRRASAMDFDDILLYTNILLRDNPDIRSHYQEFFRYILVDEYQDTNFAQHLVIHQLGKNSGNICVVGDDAQSIYSFRGASIKNILNLEKEFPGLRVFKLERNYRSTQTIINAAGSLIAKNKSQRAKNVYSENEVGEKIKIIRSYSDIEEAALVASQISRSVLTKHDSYEDYAILYRTNAQSRVLEEALRQRNIPYRIYGGLAFYQRKEVKDAISYFRLSVNPDDDEALKRIINFPGRGIGETTLKKLSSAAIRHQTSIYNVIMDPAKYEVGINRGMAAKLKSFHEILTDMIKTAREKDALETARFIYAKTGLLKMYDHDNTPEAISRQENLVELLAGIKEFIDAGVESGEGGTDMLSFLSGVFLATDQDEEKNPDKPSVTMMTVHASKGLEFKHVIIVGLEDELFPSALSMDSPAELEEERRLLYVAITRAKETCTLTWAGSRFRNGQTIYTRPSRFLLDIDTKYLDIQSGKRNSRYLNPRQNYLSSIGRTYHKSSGNQQITKNDEQNPKAPAADGTFKSTSDIKQEDLKAGVRIRHSLFGEGSIEELKNPGPDAVVIVNFDKVGVKRLMVRFARLTLL